MTDVAANAKAPRRVQLSRTKGWRLPPNTVKVDRTTRFGNPWLVGDDLCASDAVAHFRSWVEGDLWEDPSIRAQQKRLKDGLPALRGKDLACWCKLGAPCHADVLLELANLPAPPTQEGKS